MSKKSTTDRTVWPSHWTGEKRPKHAPVVFAQYIVTPKPAPASTYNEARKADELRKREDEKALPCKPPVYVLVIGEHRTAYRSIASAVKAYTAAAAARPTLLHVSYSTETVIA